MEEEEKTFVDAVTTAREDFQIRQACDAVKALLDDFVACADARPPPQFCWSDLLNTLVDRARPHVELAWHHNGHPNLIVNQLQQQSSVYKYIDLVTRWWLALELIVLGVEGLSLSSGTNMLLHGAKGAGKTTLLLGMRKVISLLGSTFVVPVYNDYEKQVRCILPAELLLSAYQARGGKVQVHTDKPDADVVAALCAGQNIFFICMFDEIQHLYPHNGQTPEEKNIDIVKQFLQLGKNINSPCIITSSAPEIVELAYSTSPRAYRFPNLNHSVFGAHVITLQSKEELVENLSKDKSVVVGFEKCFSQIPEGVDPALLRAAYAQSKSAMLKNQ